MNKIFTHLFTSLMVISSNALVAANWIGPVDIFSHPLCANPVVGVDSSGNAVIMATVSDDNTVYYSQAVQLIKGNPTNIHTLSDTSIINVNTYNNAIGVNANGNAAASWTGSSGATGLLDAPSFLQSSILLNSTWNTATSMTGTISGSISVASTPGIFIDSSNKALAIWDFQDLNSNYIIQEETFNSGWQGVVDISTISSDFLSSLSSSSSPTGNAISMWKDGTNPSTIQASYYDGSSWTQQQISTNLYNNNCVILTTVSMNGSNNAILAWINLDKGLTSLTFSNGSYGPEQTIYTLGSVNENISDVTIALDDVGNAIALWIVVNYYEPNSKILTNRYVNGVWGTPLVIDSATNDHAFSYPNIGVDAKGNGIAVWEKSVDLSNSLVYSSQYNQATNQWDNTPTLLSSAGTYTSQPKLSVNSLGGATIVWTIGQSPPINLLFLPPNQVVQAIYLLNPQPLPPQSFSGTQVKNKFLSQTEYTNILTWTASPSQNVVSYLLYSNGIKISTIAATDPLTYRDHNRNPKQIYTYELNAVNADGLASDPVTTMVK